MQRKLERSIRTQKRRILTAETTGDKEMLSVAQTRLQVLRQEYSRFSKATGLRTENERAQVVGFGGKQAVRARTETERKFEELVANAAKNDKIILDPDMENLVAGKPFSEILPLCGKLSDRAARKWYLAHDAEIAAHIDGSLSLEDQARQACKLRNRNRTHARDLMRNQKKRRELDIKEPNKSFEELLADKMKRKGLTREQAIEDILRTAAKTRKSINKQLGLG